MSVNKQINKVADVIRCLIQWKTAAEVRAAVLSIQIDATQDLTSKDQCGSALRYVSDAVHEGVIDSIDCESSTGQYFIDLVKQTLEKMDIGSYAGIAQLAHRDNTVATPHRVVYSKSLKREDTGGIEPATAQSWVTGMKIHLRMFASN